MVDEEQSRSENSTSLEDQKKDAVENLLSLYGEVLEAFKHSYQDGELNRIIDVVTKDTHVDWTGDEVILIEKKVEGEIDHPRIEKGEDPGVWIEITKGNKRININIWGGFRETGITADLKDSQKSSMANIGHAQRTADIVSGETTLGTNVIEGGILKSDTQLILDRSRGNVWLKALAANGDNVTSHLRDGVTLKTSAQSTIQEFQPILSSIFALRNQTRV